jgi:hypothetical protein
VRERYYYAGIGYVLLQDGRPYTNSEGYAAADIVFKVRQTKEGRWEAFGIASKYSHTMEQIRDGLYKWIPKE